MGRPPRRRRRRVGCAVLYLIGSLIQPVPHFGATLAVRLLAFVAVAILASLLREKMTVLEHSVEELEAIRAALTPSALPQLPGIDAAAAFVPSEHGVSGDFYLLTNGPDSSAVAIVGDVVGHGPEAARLATFIRARFAAFAASTSDPAELLTLANARTIRPAAPRARVGQRGLSALPGRGRSSPGRSPATHRHCDWPGLPSCRPRRRPSCSEPRPISA